LLCVRQHQRLRTASCEPSPLRPKCADKMMATPHPTQYLCGLRTY
jgi:hypothetical protein